MKTYQKPEILIIRIAPNAGILTVVSGKVQSVSSNADIDYSGSGSNQAARTKEYSVWDDDWNE